MNSLAPIGTIRNGESEPISAALATLLFVAPTKNVARFTPKNTPGMNACRTWRSVTRLPVHRRYTFQTTLTITILQNATRTPGDSARFTRVELSEKATTRPTTASAPHALGLSPRGCFDEGGCVIGVPRRQQPDGAGHADVCLNISHHLLIAIQVGISGSHREGRDTSAP